MLQNILVNSLANIPILHTYEAFTATATCCLLSVIDVFILPTRVAYIPAHYSSTSTFLAKSISSITLNKFKTKNTFK